MTTEHSELRDKFELVRAQLDHNIGPAWDALIDIEEQLGSLREALLGVRNRTEDETGEPCYCPDWMYEEWIHGFADERQHHEACVRARATLAASKIQE